MPNTVFMLHFNQNTFLARESQFNNGFELWVSEDNGKTFNQAIFPFRDTLTEGGYVILDDSEGAAFIHVTHTGDNFFGNLYSSNKLGDVYDLVMKDQSRTLIGVDFVKMFGLDGIYLSNQIVRDTLDDDANMKATMITFDLGGVWHNLALPTGINGSQVVCTTPNCALQLHAIYKRAPSSSQSSVTSFGPLYSTENAVGILIGTGNIGDQGMYLDSFYDLHFFLKTKRKNF